MSPVREGWTAGHHASGYVTKYAIRLRVAPKFGQKADAVCKGMQRSAKECIGTVARCS